MTRSGKLDWDDVLDSVLGLVDGPAGLVGLAVVGALLGVGAASLLHVESRWLGTLAGAVLVPTLIALLARAAQREDAGE